MVRTSPGLDDFIKPWVHPGIEQCKVPYYGKFGEHLKANIGNDSLYASVQCGISGSLYFQLFSYLMSHTQTPIKNPQDDFETLLLLSIVALVGDGGHNIMEVVYGYIIAIIILYKTLEVFTEELQILFDNKNSFSDNIDLFNKTAITMEQLENTPLILAISQTIYSKQVDMKIYFHSKEKKSYYRMTVLKLFLNNWVNWEPFITTAYKLTDTINIIGVSQEDLDSYDPNILKESDIDFETLDILFMFYTGKSWKGISWDKFSPEFNDYVQIYFALENNRYKDGKKSWETSPTNLITKILTTYPQGQRGLDMIDRELQRKFKNCDVTKYKSGDIPFAFPKPR